MADFLSMSLEGDFEAALDRLAGEVKGKLLRTGGNTMGFVFQQEAKLRAPVFEGEARYIPLSKSGKSGGYWIKPGQLRDAIYRAHDDSGSSESRQAYEVSWNHSKAPHGHWMEYGNSRHAAHPFIRPAFDAAAQRAVQAGLDRMTVKYAETNFGGGA